VTGPANSKHFEISSHQLIWHYRDATLKVNVICHDEIVASDDKIIFCATILFDNKNIIT